MTSKSKGWRGWASPAVFPGGIPLSASHWTPKGHRPKHPATELDVLDRVIVTPEGCWIWTGGTSGGEWNYPRILKPGTRRMMAAHRYVFKLLRPHIHLPDRIQLDHRCADWCAAWGGDRRFHRLCVNPDHLEPVTGAENTRRMHDYYRPRLDVDVWDRPDDLLY